MEPVLRSLGPPDLPAPSPHGRALYLHEVRGALAELAYGAKYGPRPERVEGYVREVAGALDRLEAFLSSEVK